MPKIIPDPRDRAPSLPRDVPTLGTWFVQKRTDRGLEPAEVQRLTAQLSNESEVSISYLNYIERDKRSISQVGVSLLEGLRVVYRIGVKEFTRVTGRHIPEIKLLGLVEFNSGDVIGTPIYASFDHYLQGIPSDHDERSNASAIIIMGVNQRIYVEKGLMHIHPTMFSGSSVRIFLEEKQPQEGGTTLSYEKKSGAILFMQHRSESKAVYLEPTLFEDEIILSNQLKPNFLGILQGLHLEYKHLST